MQQYKISMKTIGTLLVVQVLECFLSLANGNPPCFNTIGLKYRCISAKACLHAVTDSTFPAVSCGPEDRGFCCPVIAPHSPPKCGIRNRYMAFGSEEPKNKADVLSESSKSKNEFLKLGNINPLFHFDYEKNAKALKGVMPFGSPITKQNAPVGKTPSADSKISGGMFKSSECNHPSSKRKTADIEQIRSQLFSDYNANFKSNNKGIPITSPLTNENLHREKKIMSDSNVFVNAAQINNLVKFPKLRSQISENEKIPSTSSLNYILYSDDKKGWSSADYNVNSNQRLKNPLTLKVFVKNLEALESIQLDFPHYPKSTKEMLNFEQTQPSKLLESNDYSSKIRNIEEEIPVHGENSEKKDEHEQVDVKALDHISENNLSVEDPIKLFKEHENPADSFHNVRDSLDTENKNKDFYKIMRSEGNRAFMDQIGSYYGNPPRQPSDTKMPQELKLLAQQENEQFQKEAYRNVQVDNRQYEHLAHDYPQNPFYPNDFSSVYDQNPMFRAPMPQEHYEPNSNAQQGLPSSLLVQVRDNSDLSYRSNSYNNPSNPYLFPLAAVPCNQGDISINLSNLPQHRNIRKPLNNFNQYMASPYCRKRRESSGFSNTKFNLVVLPENDYKKQGLKLGESRISVSESTHQLRVKPKRSAELGLKTFKSPSFGLFQTTNRRNFQASIENPQERQQRSYGIPIDPDNINSDNVKYIGKNQAETTVNSQNFQTKLIVEKHHESGDDAQSLNDIKITIEIKANQNASLLSKPPTLLHKSGLKSEKEDTRRHQPAYTIGGKLEDHPWPWMVSIYSSPNNRFVCAGTLIDEWHVLTAAHCFSPKPPNHLFVFIGRLKRLIADHPWEELTVKKEAYTVQALFLHNGFKKSCFCNDIAILRLRKPAGLQHVPACLPAVDITALGGNATIIGWGDTYFESKYTAGLHGTIQLQRVDDLNIFPSEECRNMILKSSGFVMPETFGEQYICAGVKDGSKDACVGDSGGPLMYEDYDGVWTLVGIVSFGFDCGRPNLPGTYTKVSYYLPWIMNIIRLRI